MSTVQLAKIVVNDDVDDGFFYDDDGGEQLKTSLLMSNKRVEWAKSNAIDITISRTTNALTFEQYMIATAKLTPIQQTEYLLRFTQ